MLEWKGTIYEANLSPQVLFREKFDGYLHQKRVFHYPACGAKIPRKDSVYANTVMKQIFNQAMST